MINPSIRNNGKYFLVLISVLCLVTQYYYYRSNLVYDEQTIFYISLGLLSLSFILSIIIYPNNRGIHFTLLLLCSMFFNLMYVYYSYDFPYIPPRDATFHWKISNDITNSGFLNSNLYDSTLQNDYASYPGFHILISIFTIICGFNSEYVVKFIPLIFIILPFIMYCFTNFLFKKHIISCLSAYIMIFLIKWYSFPSYSKFVIIYLSLFLYYLLKMYVSNDHKYNILLLMSAFGVSITHHVTNYLLIIFIMSLMIITFILKSYETRIKYYVKNFMVLNISYYNFILLIIICILYPFYSNIKFFTTEYHLGVLIRYLSPVYESESFSVSVLGGFDFGQQYFILFIMFMFGVIGVIGFLLYLFNDEIPVYTINSIYVLFIGGLAVVSIPFMFLNTVIMHYVRYRLLYIIYAILAPYASYFFILMLNKKHNILSYNFKLFLFVISFISLTFCATLLVPESYYRFSSEEDSGYLWEFRSHPNSLYSSLMWLDQTSQGASFDYRAIGDTPIKIIGNGMFDLNIDYLWDIYLYPGNITKYKIDFFDKYNISYIFIDALMSEYKQQPDFARFIDPLPKGKIELLLNDLRLNQIYSNGIIMNMYINDIVYSINAVSGSGGNIDPSIPVLIEWAENQDYTINPNSGYHISDVLVDNLSIGAKPQYQFIMMDDSHTIEAQFEPDILSGLLMDSGFEYSHSSDYLRANGATQDWYESQGGMSTLLILDETDVGGNTGRKAAFAESSSGNAYLSQEFSAPQTGTFSAQWDIYVDSIMTASPYRAAIMLIGDDSYAGSGPNADNSERFVYMAFEKPGGGLNGTMNLVAWDRDDPLGSFTVVKAGFNLDQWYTIKVVCDLDADTYDVYVDGELALAGITSRVAKNSVTHISFAQLFNGVGAFCVDNVYAR